MENVREYTEDLDTELEMRGFDVTEDMPGSFTVVNKGRNYETMSVNVSREEFGGFELTVQVVNEMNFPTMERRIEYTDESDLEDNVVNDATMIVDRNTIVNL